MLRFQMTSSRKRKWFKLRNKKMLWKVKITFIKMHVLGVGKQGYLQGKCYQAIKQMITKKNNCYHIHYRAAEEIKERLSSLSIDDDTLFGTIHQFCLEFIIYPFKWISHISKGFTIIDDYTQRAYVSQINNMLNLNLKTYELNKIDLSLSHDFKINEVQYTRFWNVSH